MGRSNLRWESIDSMVTERDKKPNGDGNNIYYKYQLMPPKVKIFYSHKNDKVNTTELHKIEAFPYMYKPG